MCTVPTQVGTGIHLRLKARAFVFREGEDDSKMVAYVNMDTGMGSDIVRIKAIEKANEILGKEVFSTVSVLSQRIIQHRHQFLLHFIYLDVE